MKAKIAFIIVCLLFLSGCLVKSKCRIINETFNVTEVQYRSIPRNVTENYTITEPYLVERYEDIPFKYDVVMGVDVYREKLIDDYGERIEYGRVNQMLNGTVYVTLTNNDTEGGLFRVELTVFRGSVNESKEKTAYINASGSENIRFDFVLVRGSGWSYEFRVFPPVRKVVVNSVAYHEVNRTRRVIVLDTVREEVMKTIVNPVEVC
jgi:hypothetical protein